jgi:hypothetical protein
VRQRHARKMAMAVGSGSSSISTARVCGSASQRASRASFSSSFIMLTTSIRRLSTAEVKKGGQARPGGPHGKLPVILPVKLPVFPGHGSRRGADYWCRTRRVVRGRVTLLRLTASSHTT